MGRGGDFLLLRLVLLPLIALLGFSGGSLRLAVAQVKIPPRLDGFVYDEGLRARKDLIVVDAFFDPMCPDSRDSWPPLKRAIRHYHPRIFLTVHPFALPYHDNAFVASRALHIANKLNASATYPLLELFYKKQEIYYNKPTRGMSRESIVRHIAKLAAKAIGDNSLSAIESGFEDPKTDMATRTSFKYGCSRGVTGTPYFFVNGFPLPDGGSPLNLSTWKSVVDPLLGKA